MLINLRASTVAAGILSTLIIIKESCFATRMKWGMFGFCNHTYCIMITFPTLLCLKARHNECRNGR